MFSAQEASDWGLISRVVSDKHEETLQEAIAVAEKIASKGKISVQAAKEAVGHGECMTATKHRIRPYRLIMFLVSTSL